MAGLGDQVSVFKGPVGPLRHRCPQCSATGPQLLRCTGCRAVRYCSREHQVSHRAEHKAVCSRAKKFRAKLANEDYRVRNATADFMTPANAFETSVGRFWGIVSTRNYMRARFALADHLRELGTLDGVREALYHMQDMLRLCRGDNMGLRNSVPALMLRLDLDQECYDFVKWWATCDLDGTYDWGDVTLPHLDLRGADAMEDANIFGRFPLLNHVVAILLLKLKLLVDIRNIKITRKIVAFRRLPFELSHCIEAAVVRSPLSIKFAKAPPDYLPNMESRLQRQICTIARKLAETNKNFVFSLFEPDEALGTRPEAYTYGSWEEMAVAMQISYAAWWETEGVLDILSDARACASRDSDDEIPDMMESETFVKGSGRTRTAKELLADVSVNRIWGYMDWAVENASYLGPSSERPSEQHRRRNQARREKMLAEEEDEDF